MRLCLTSAVLVVLSGSSVLANPGYVNSRGDLVELTPAPEHLARRAVVEPGGEVYLVPGTEKIFALDRGVIVRLYAPGRIGDLLEQAGLVLVEQLGRDGTMFLCYADNARKALEATVVLSQIPEVKWALPDFKVPIKLYYQPNDPYYQYQWYHYQATGEHIGSEDAWNTTMGDPQVIVAVIDTGVDLGHPDLDPNRVVTGYNAQTESDDPTPLGSTIDAHGTCCSGEILASADNGEGMVGVCPGCSLMPIKMMDGQAETQEISVGFRAIEFATANGAWVISNSWGIDGMMLNQVDMQPFYDAVQDAVANGRGGFGTVVLFASGNGNMFTGQGEPIGERELPNMPEAMAVGGTGPDDQRVMYSDYGPNLSVVAPTGSIQLDPNNMYDGPQILTTDTTGDQGFSRGGKYWMPGLFGEQETDYEELDTTGNYTSYFNGTSAACPIAAGVVAMTFSANPDLTGTAARRIVEGTADKVGDDANYDAEGHDEKYGFGRVNVARAVRAAPYGVDNPDGSICAEDVNCLGGLCAILNPDDPVGICAEACDTGADCGDGRICATLPSGLKICLPACTTHEDCVHDEVCVDGACMSIACQDGTECPEGTACPQEGGFCQPACESDEDCLDPELCLEALGGSLCIAVACTGDADCPSDLECGDDGFCNQPAEQPDGGQTDAGQTDAGQADGGQEPGGNGGCGCSAARSGGLPRALLVFTGFAVLTRRKRQWTAGPS